MISNEQNNTPLLYGLVLAGGKSTRMGHDKGIMEWHGIPQRYYMANMLKDICVDVFISCRPEQQQEIAGDYKTLPDTCTGAGPLSGILSAFQANPNVAWLVIACDLPLLDTATLQYLIANRNPSSIATTFESPFDHLPEPLITIWEPASYEALRAWMAEGRSCPRKVLIRNEEKVTILKAPNPDTLMNANTPEDAEKVKSLLR